MYVTYLFGGQSFGSVYARLAVHLELEVVPELLVVGRQGLRVALAHYPRMGEHVLGLPSLPHVHDEQVVDEIFGS